MSLLWFLWDGMGEVQQAGLGLVNLNNFSGLCWHRGCPACLVPGPGTIRVIGWPEA